MYGNDGFYPPDVLEQDLNGDGIIDAVFTDTDLDGIYDLAQYDTNGDGIADTIAMGQELSAGGFFERQSTMYDYDGDGLIDAEQSFRYDASTGELLGSDSFEYVDVNGDGQPDAVLHSADVNGDGVLDITEEMNANYDIIHFEYLTEDYQDFMERMVDSPWENFNPATMDASHVTGDVSDIEHWEMQDGNSCAIFSQMFMIEELTGLELDPNELVDRAMQMGVYSGDGTSAENLDALLESYGLQTEFHDGGTLEDIAGCLENGGKVLTVIEADELWSPDDAASYLSNDSGHAVQVVGIDYADPNNPMVILNDSGTPHGAGELVPADSFLEAWENTGYAMVEAYA